jgi:glycosyltransferase involved in cell wall biosynthesis
MKVCMLTTTHRPHDGRIYQKEAKSLAKEHQVTIIAPSDTASVESHHNLNIVTVRKPASNLLHPVTLWREFKACLGQKSDVIHCHEPDALLVALLLKAIQGKRVVYDIHEHWPSEIPVDFGLASPKVLYKALQSLLSPLEIFLSRSSDALIAVSDSVAERFNGDGKTPVIISNFSIVDPAIPHHHNSTGRNLICMAGNMQLFHGIRECIQALSLVRTKYPDVSLTLIGEIGEEAEGVVADAGLEEKIRKTGYLPYRQMYEEIGRGEIGLLIFQPEYYNVYIGLPNKLFDYMLCGLPVIASDFPEIRKVVAGAECGILVDPTNPEEIAEAVAYLLEHPEEAQRMGENGRRAVEEKYNWRREEKRLMDLYNSLNGSDGT